MDADSDEDAGRPTANAALPDDDDEPLPGTGPQPGASRLSLLSSFVRFSVRFCGLSVYIFL